MQVTLDLPDDVYADALAVAKQESRSLSSLVGDLIRGKVRSSPVPKPTPALRPGYRFPVVEGARQFTQEEIDRMLEEDGLP